MRKACLAASACGVVLIVWVVYGRMFEMTPWSGDNIRILSWAHDAPASAVVQADPAVYPEWRPLAYLTVWLQYRWLQLDHVNVFYGINLLLWIGCALLVYAIVHRFAASIVPAAIASALVFVDERAVGPLSGIERANLLACVFGLAALFLIVYTRDGCVSTARAMGIALLLLASGLSKEYGLAFTAAVAVASINLRHRAFGTAALAAGLTYGLLRLMFANGALAPYCEDVGYFSELRSVCFASPRALATPQAIYNVAATAIGTLVPAMFTTWGQFFIDPFEVPRQVIWVAFAALGWWKGPRHARITLGIVAANATLSFMLYRARNQVVGVCAIGIAVGVGLAVAHTFLQAQPRWRLMRGIAIASLLTLLVVEAGGTRAVVSTQAAESHRVDPCDALREGRPLDRAFVRRIKIAYAMPDPDCIASR